MFTLAVLSGERYTAIVHQMSKHMLKLITVITVVGIWIFATVLAIPEAVTPDLMYYLGHMPNTCNTIIIPPTIAYCDIYPDGRVPTWCPKAQSVIIIGAFYTMMARILVARSQQVGRCPASP
ncbi:hypothetical protein DPMN_049798 [Dreissena polymorpha]|uniref:G-protein coupled receptors family 1 profile domain-containing protein n=1 Tax=Dreissena polymorpha TaxID=45954 RepID=A0A9D4HMH8_DREPO|nr:hypothetical protein DPMN_049798 [Dreissena polymorpha]